MREREDFCCEEKRVGEWVYIVKGVKGTDVIIISMSGKKLSKFQGGRIRRITRSQTLSEDPT